MFFSKKQGYHCLVLYTFNDEPQPLFIVIPSELASDVVATMRKFEKSSLNNDKILGTLGPFTIVHDIQGFQKLEIYNDSFSWSEPILYTDYAQKVSDKLQSLMDDESDDVEEDLVYFIGEFTMMQDNGFVAPF